MHWDSMRRPPMLGTRARGRDNNFNLLRLVCALTVLIGHAVTNIAGPEGTSPAIFAFLSWAIRAALEVFFILSGYLITASMLQTGSHVRYWAQRLGRIMPGLFVVSVFAALVVGPLATTLTLTAYFKEPDVARYIGWTAFAIPDHPLPGVFVDHILPGSVNEPLWTLRYELFMYMAVSVAFATGLLRPRIFAVIGGALLAAYLLNASWLHVDQRWTPLMHLLRFSLAFGLGASFWLFRGGVPLSGWLALGAGLVALSARGTPLEQLTQVLALGCGAIYLAYIPQPLRVYNRLGDYSYGVYVYHWPVGSLIHAVWPDLAASGLLLATLVTTLPLAVASWHVIEAPSLRFMRMVPQLRPVVDLSEAAPEALKAPTSLPAGATAV